MALEWGDKMDEIVQFEKFETLGKALATAHRLSESQLTSDEGKCIPIRKTDRKGLEDKMPPRQGFLKTALEQLLNKIHAFESQVGSEADYIKEIAAHLYEVVSVFGDDTFKDRELMANGFMQYFMKGYLSEREMLAAHLKEIALYLRLEEWQAHVNLYHTWNLNDMDQWQCDYFEQTKSRIIHNIPIVAFRDDWMKSKSGVGLNTPTVTVKLQPSFALLFVS